jgi:hypothetical protein
MKHAVAEVFLFAPSAQTILASFAIDLFTLLFSPPTLLASVAARATVDASTVRHFQLKR